MIKEAIKKLVEKHDLTQTETSSVMGEIMEGLATPSQIAAFITALRMKGETIEEITGFAEQMRRRAAVIRPRVDILVDTCGTGGDLAGTFNISTVSAFVAAGAGVTIAKHGNRSVSSSCGSADLLEALGAKIDLPPPRVEECINQVGIGFIFAPVFHESMKYATLPRREIGIRTVFNILGPLTNPANAAAQVLGVFAEKLTDVLAEVLNNLGTKEAFVVHGLDGLDEISICQETKISHLKSGVINTYYITPEDFGFSRGKREDILGGGPEVNAKIARGILSAKDKSCRRDIVVLNSAAAIVAAGIAGDLGEGVKLAVKSIDSGNAEAKLKEFINFSKSES